MVEYLLSLATTTALFTAGMAYIVWRAKVDADRRFRETTAAMKATFDAAVANLPVLVPPPPTDLDDVDDEPTPAAEPAAP